MTSDYSFDGELWMHTGEGAWHFVTLPGQIADEIQARQDGQRPGFGSVRVSATIGSTTWQTSLFPDSARESYLLPVKQQVRAREHVGDGDLVCVHVELLED